jgi:hypothetical protein
MVDAHSPARQQLPRERSLDSDVWVHTGCRAVAGRSHPPRARRAQKMPGPPAARLVDVKQDLPDIVDALFNGTPAERYAACGALYAEDAVLWNSMYTCALARVEFGEGRCGGTCQRMHARWSCPSVIQPRARRRLACRKAAEPMLSLLLRCPLTWCCVAACSLAVVAPCMALSCPPYSHELFIATLHNSPAWLPSH